MTRNRNTNPEDDYRAAWLAWRFGTQDERDRAERTRFARYTLYWALLLAVGFVMVLAAAQP